MSLLYYFVTTDGSTPTKGKWNKEMKPGQLQKGDRDHERRMETEGKAKVIVSVWVAKFVQFLAALAVLPRSIWKKRLNSAGLFGRNG